MSDIIFFLETSQLLCRWSHRRPGVRRICCFRSQTYTCMRHGMPARGNSICKEEKQNDGRCMCENFGWYIPGAHNWGEYVPRILARNFHTLCAHWTAFLVHLCCRYVRRVYTGGKSYARFSCVRGTIFPFAGCLLSRTFIIQVWETIMSCMY